MTRSTKTKKLLIGKAKAFFWGRGFSRVSLREIAGDAGVDVALISRYFGSKRGLFEATLVDFPKLNLEEVRDKDALISFALRFFTSPREEPMPPSVISLVLYNINDAEVGECVRRLQDEKWMKPLSVILGSEVRSSMYLSVVMGLSMGEKVMKLGGIPHYETELYRDLWEYALRSACDMPMKGGRGGKRDGKE